MAVYGCPDVLRVVSGSMMATSISFGSTLGLSRDARVGTESQKVSHGVIQFLEGSIKLRLQLKQNTLRQSLASKVASSRPSRTLTLLGGSAVKCEAKEASGRGPLAEDASRPQPPSTTRRNIFQAAIAGTALVALQGLEREPASAFLVAPGGYRVFVDKLDGYSFFFPQDWLSVKGAGADAFFRDPIKLDENLSVNISSPSSSRYKAVADLGSPEEAGAFILKQYLNEFMSTRLGVQRDSTLLSAQARTGSDGRQYYDIQANVKSYANTNQLAIMPEERVVQLEWDRRYILTLGVENGRLYQLRLQLPERLVQSDMATLQTTIDSFQLIRIADQEEA